MLPELLDPSVTLLIMGLCLWLSLRLLYGARGPTPDDDVFLLIRILSRSLVFVAITGLLVASATLLSLVLLAIVLEAVLEMVLARRAAQRHAAWRALASSASGRPATVQTLRLHQSRFSGIVGGRFRRLLLDLERGVAWNEAIATNRRALPSLAVTYLGAMTASAPADDLAELRAAHDTPYRQIWHDTVQRFVYLMTVLAVLATVFIFTAIKLVPSYQGIYQDFDLQIPATTAVVFDSLSVMTPSVAMSMAVALAAIIAAAGFIAVAYLCDWPVLQPLLDWVGFARHRAHIMRLLAAAVARDTPLTEALSRLASGWAAYPSWLARHRLAAAGERIAAGQSWTESLQRSRLISATDAATLRAAQETGHLPWTLRMLADRKLRLFIFRWAAVQHILFTIAILIVGAIVFFFILAMFIPLVTLIESLA